jgi:hypothetical protein
MENNKVTGSIEEEAETAFTRNIKLTSLKIDELSKQIKDFDGILKNDIKNINFTITKLEEASILLNIIPRDVSSEINQIAPKVAHNILNEMNVNLLRSFNTTIEKCKNKVNDLHKDIESLIDTINLEKSNRFKRTLFNLLFIAILSLLSTVGATYFVLMQFPQTIRIDHSGNINVEQSRVFVEGTNNFYPYKNTKIIKK